MDPVKLPSVRSLEHRVHHCVLTRFLQRHQQEQHFASHKSLCRIPRTLSHIAEAEGTHLVLSEMLRRSDTSNTAHINSTNNSSAQSRCQTPTTTTTTTTTSAANPSGRVGSSHSTCSSHGVGRRTVPPVSTVHARYLPEQILELHVAVRPQDLVALKAVATTQVNIRAVLLPHNPLDELLFSTAMEILTTNQSITHWGWQHYCQHANGLTMDDYYDDGQCGENGSRKSSRVGGNLAGGGAGAGAGGSGGGWRSNRTAAAKRRREAAWAKLIRRQLRANASITAQRQQTRWIADEMRLYEASVDKLTAYLNQFIVAEKTLRADIITTEQHLRRELTTTASGARSAAVRRDRTYRLLAGIADRLAWVTGREATFRMTLRQEEFDASAALLLAMEESWRHAWTVTERHTRQVAKALENRGWAAATRDEHARRERYKLEKKAAEDEEHASRDAVAHARIKELRRLKQVEAKAREEADIATFVRVDGERKEAAHQKRLQEQQKEREARAQREAAAKVQRFVAEQKKELDRVEQHEVQARRRWLQAVLAALKAAHELADLRPAARGSSGDGGGGGAPTTAANASSDRFEQAKERVRQRIKATAPAPSSPTTVEQSQPPNPALGPSTPASSPPSPLAPAGTAADNSTTPAPQAIPPAPGDHQQQAGTVTVDPLYVFYCDLLGICE